MRYVKDAIAASLLMLLVPLLLLLFPVVIIALAVRRVQWGIERRNPIEAVGG